MAASAFSSDEERVISRELDARDASAFTSFQLDIEGTAAHILRSGHKRVALQFPDQLLSHAGRAVASLRLATAANDAAINFFVLGDTSFDGFQVDFVAAQHFNADFIVHYGPVDLEARGPLPVRFVFGVRHLDVNAVVAACAAAFGGDAERVLIVPSLPYAHASDALALELGRSSTAACRGAVICHSDVERGAEEQLGGTVASSSAAGGSTTSNPLTAGDALAQGRLLGRRLSEPLDEEALGGCALIYVGGEDQTLSNLCLLLPSAAVYLYELSDVDPVGDDAAATGAAVSPPPSLRRLELATARRLMRRYFLVQKAREAEVVGVLVGTLSASQRGPMLSALKALCRRAGRKHYVFVMGKLNAAKLANFSEVGVYVLLGSAEHSLLDSKEFYRPVVTPYELHVALSDGAEWTGEYLLDYGRLLPRLRAEEEEEAAASAAGPTAADDEEDDEPQFSALTGRLIAKRPVSNGVLTASGSGSAGGGGGATPGTLVATSGGGGVLAQRGDYAMARTGAEALARREYRGLEPRLGEHAPSRIVEGRSGIASGFSGEGVGGEPAEAAQAAQAAAEAAVEPAMEAAVGVLDAAAVDAPAAAVPLE